MPPRRRYERTEELRPGANLYARWDVERDIVSFAIVLLAWADGGWWVVALFDCSHEGRNDRHRYDRDGTKGPAEVFHHGTPAEAFRAAIALIVADYERMIDLWRQ